MRSEDDLVVMLNLEALIEGKLASNHGLLGLFICFLTPDGQLSEKANILHSQVKL